MWAIFKVFIEFITILLLFYIWVFGAKKHVKSYLPQLAIEPAPPALELKVLITAP